MSDERRGWRKIGVEPVMFLYMAAFMITSVVEEAFFVYKACTVNLNFTREICDNITSDDYKSEREQVQIKVSSFHQYENIAQFGIPIILAFFLGSWSDKVGRKLPLLLGLVGNLIYSSMIVVNAVMVDWPVEAVLYSACLPCALTGGNMTVFMSAFSYLSDTTTQEERTIRTTILEIAYLLPMPLGVALGSYLFHNVLEKSYAGMFMINATCLVLAIIFTWILIEWKTTQGQNNSNEGSFLGLIDLRHVAASVKALVKPRPDNRRFYLLLALLAIALYTFQRDEKHMVYLYTQHIFHWDVAKFSTFRTFQSSFFILGLLIGTPFLAKCLDLKDMVIIMVGAMSHFITRIIFATAKVPWMFYVGAVVASLGPIIAPVLRSLVSKLVPSSDRGKIFAMLSVADMTVPLVSGIVYSQVYNATLTTHPEYIFFVTGVTQIGVFVIALFMNIMLKGKNLSQELDIAQTAIETEVNA